MVLCALAGKLVDLVLLALQVVLGDTPRLVFPNQVKNILAGLRLDHAFWQVDLDLFEEEVDDLVLLPGLRLALEARRQVFADLLAQLIDGFELERLGKLVIQLRELLLANADDLHLVFPLFSGNFLVEKLFRKLDVDVALVADLRSPELVAKAGHEGILRHQQPEVLIFAQQLCGGADLANRLAVDCAMIVEDGIVTQLELTVRDLRKIRLLLADGGE